MWKVFKELLIKVEKLQVKVLAIILVELHFDVLLGLNQPAAVKAQVYVENLHLILDEKNFALKSQPDSSGCVLEKSTKLYSNNTYEV